ncbi:MAG TPA: F0F1 ATP synthase subunit B [Gammaproteobacteria bacterium]|nr:F0F1 ATP synthase subunit B [Gammaproteobacteria bacterium]
MAIDWLTVGAQVVNFLVLVYLLQHFLYHPVIDAMDRREERIARRLADAEARENEAEEAARAYRDKQEALEAERQQRLEDAEAEAAERRDALLADARQEVQSLREQWQADLEGEQAAFRRDMRQAVAQAVARISRRVLGELADAALEERMVARFLDRLTELDEEQRAALQAADTLTVRTAFPLNPERRDRLEQGVRERLAAEGAVTFETADALLCGIEVAGGGRKAGWSVDQYLAILDAALRQEIAAVNRGAD